MPAATRFRPTETSDLTRGPGWLEASEPRVDRWRDDTTRSVISLVGGQPVAIGRIWTAQVHHTRYWMEVVVDPERRRCGHGTDLALHLADLRPDRRPLCTRGDVDSETIAFARSLGAQPYQVCPPEHVPTSSGALLVAGGGRPSTVTGRAVDRSELRRAWVETYAWTHADWSPVATGFEAPLLEPFDLDIDLDHSRFVIDTSGAVRAGAYVFGGGPEPVVCAECRSRDEPDGMARLSAAVGDALSALAAAGHPGAVFDGHRSDPHFPTVLAALPATGTEFWLVEWD